MKYGSLRGLNNEYKSFASHLLSKIRTDTNIAFRIIAVVFGVSHLGGFKDSSVMRFFLAMCLLWSVVLTGAFTVSKYIPYIKLFALHLLPIKTVKLSEWEMEIRYHLIRNLSHTSLTWFVHICTSKLKMKGNLLRNKNKVFLWVIKTFFRYAQYGENLLIDIYNDELESGEGGGDELSWIIWGCSDVV